MSISRLCSTFLFDHVPLQVSWIPRHSVLSLSEILPNVVNNAMNKVDRLSWQTMYGGDGSINNTDTQ